jgi:predicted alpha-1,2-mannosidase
MQIMKYILLLLIFPAAAIAQPPVKYVDPLIGTGPARTISAIRQKKNGADDFGQNFPGIGRPFGMTQWTPETRTTENKCVSPYYYNDKHITGFRGSHWMSGSCTQDYGSATLMPFTTDNADTLSVAPVSRLSHSNELSTASYYRLLLEDSGITAELAGSARSGMLRFTFPGNRDSYLLIRMNSDRMRGALWIDTGKNEIIGYNPVYRLYQGRGQSAGFSGYFIFRFDKPFKSIPQLLNRQQIVVCFANEKVVNVKSGTSFTSIEAARNNLDREIPYWDFESLRQASEDEWNRTLSRIQVKGGSEEDLVKFYTALYHCYQLPRIASDADGSYQGFAGDTIIHKVRGCDYYDDFSMWDTYRALHPLMTIIEPEKTADMIKSLILKAEQGGWMPIFPAWANYTAAMIGDHVSTAIADAYLKGIRDFDAEKAYKYMRQNAFDHPGRSEYVDGKGRRALASYLKYGYIPLEDSVLDAFHKREQVSRTLEYAFDDYALAQYAKALGKMDDYNVLIKRSENWKNVFDRQTGFVRGRYADGRWIEPFDPYVPAWFICEGTPFQYTWYVPHDITGLIQAMGGKTRFLDRLNDFFEKDYYWHGNETDQQAAYIFTMAGQPGKTQEWVNRIIKDEYDTGPGGLSGNEDAGQMSAWLVFSMMGFFPVCPASSSYIVTTPAFDEVRILLPSGEWFSVNTLNRDKDNIYISNITRNGTHFNKWYISHEEIMNGSKFTFRLGPKP